QRSFFVNLQAGSLRLQCGGRGLGQREHDGPKGSCHGGCRRGRGFGYLCRLGIRNCRVGVL
ncbi:MAG: hypothetical protein ACK55Z_37185, partial [bacterium]